MKKFTYPKLAVISINIADSVLADALVSPNPTGGDTTTNVIDHSYSGGSSYRIWKNTDGGRDYSAY